MTSIFDKPISSLTELNWEKALFVVIIVVALATRLWGLGERVQSHDESIHTQYSWNLYTGRGFQHQPLMHGPFLFHVTALSYFLFSDNDFTARLPVAIMGVLVVAFPWLLRRWLGRSGALVASFLLLISPSIAYYSRYIRHDIPIILWSLVVIWAIFSYLRDGRARWLYLMAAGVSLMFATKEVAFIYNAIFGFFLLGLFAIQALGRKWSSEGLKPMFLAALVAMAVGGIILGSGLLLRPEGQSVPAWWALSGGVLAGLALLVAVAFLLIGTWHDLRDFRSFDLLIILGTLCLPFLSPMLISLVGLDPIDYQPPTIYYSGIITGVILLISAGIGLAWDWRRWGIAAAIHYTIFVILFTTVFTSGTGIASGMVGSLGYWLAQQEVERGSQPWYYYAITVLFYEYLPLLLTLIATIYYVILRPRFLDRETQSGKSEPRDPAPVSGTWNSQFIPFVLWWVAMAWLGYSYAGEKMPWLTVHIALPMILLSGWLVGQFIETMDWRQALKRRAWLLAIVAPPFVMALTILINAVLAGPFQGYEMQQLNATGQFLNGILGTLGFGAGLMYLIYRIGWRTALRIMVAISLLVPVFVTVRTAWRFCYVNYDYPIEFLVYAHAGPAVHEAMRQIDELSRRTAGGPNLIKVAYGADGSTLFYWQFRNYPNAVFYSTSPSREQMESPVVIAGRDEWDAVTPYLGDDYLVNTYTYLWWPIEDYRNMTWERIGRAITDAETRAALWDIWYDRDFRRYETLTGKKYSLDEWPLRSEFRLYVRRDVVAQMWDLGTAKPIEVGSVDPYDEGWQALSARVVFGSQGSGPGQFERPNGIAIGPDGYVYVADTGNHRIQKFTPDGQFVATWGKNSTIEAEAGLPQGFNEPWGVALAPDGSIYVADTWNHRVHKLDDRGNLIHAWGLFGQYGTGDVAGQSAFYGPRDVVVGTDGQVYVTDTGNKRVQVFDADGRFVFQWGGGGVLEGYLDEPVGIAFGPSDEVYVADTWNRRVQVFDPRGNFVRQWPIRGWDAGLADEKPYLDIDADGYVYVTDPGHYRVLVFDNLGNFVLSFGQYGFDQQSFALPTGIAIADDGSIYVADSHGARILVFDPLKLNAGLVP
jgi:predicted membrane-bound mannosyltransferase/DNA-binding beta-propeller fold protein YncE